MAEKKSYPLIVQQSILQHIRGGNFMGNNENSSKGITMGDALVIFEDDLDELEKMYSSLNNTPKEIIERILEEIIGQDEAVEKLTVAVYYNQMLNLIEEMSGDNRYDRLTTFLIGNTGVGKTATVKALSKYFNVPFVRYSVDSITSAGYVGNKVEDILINLFNKANRDLALAERGIIFLDEFDKKVKQETSSGRDINGEAVQQELLKFLEPSLVELSLSDRTRVPFETGKLTVILGGACIGLDKVRDKRLHRVPKVGFSCEEKSQIEKEEYISEDLINYGLIPELVGRITVIDTFRDLDDNDIYNILMHSSNSPYKKLITFFVNYLNVEMQVSKEFLKAISKGVVEAGTGARGLKSKIWKIFYPITKEAIENRANYGICIIHSDGSYILEYDDITFYGELEI